MHENNRFKLASGVTPGEPLSSTSLRNGTVRMEEHPDYDSALQLLNEYGFKLSLYPDNYVKTHVLLKLVCDPRSPYELSQATVIKEVKAVRGMRWLDLQHELIHIEQVVERFLTQGVLIFTEVDIVNATPKEAKHFVHSTMLREWQNQVFELHARMIEFLRLYEVGCSENIIVEHLEGVLKHADLFWRKSAKKLKSESRKQWIEKYFSDIPDLQKDVHRIHKSEFWYLNGRVK